MIAKLIASAPTRDEAAEILADELDFTAAWPVKTNAGFLVKALRHPRFLSGDVETGFIAATLESLVPEPSPKEGMWKLAALNLGWMRSEEHTSELQSLMRISYAVFCLKQKKKNKTHTT